MIFPWHEPYWQQLLFANKSKRLPHALLLSGLSGIGKALFAERFIRLLLCERKNLIDHSCKGNECHACHLITNRSHPNILWLFPEKDTIKVDQIRQANEFAQHSSFTDDYRFVLINPANAMNISAANALLKTLEEPPAQVILILISDAPYCLPATIRSRCQRLHFQLPDQQNALSWLQANLSTQTIAPELLLKLANGAPLTALSLAADKKLAHRELTFQQIILSLQKIGNVLDATKVLLDIDLLTFIDFNLSLLLDIIRLQIGGDLLTNQDYNVSLNKIANQYSMMKHLTLIEDIQTLRKQMLAGIHLNKQLVIENILYKWATSPC